MVVLAYKRAVIDTINVLNMQLGLFACYLNDEFAPVNTGTLPFLLLFQLTVYTHLSKLISTVSLKLN